MLVKYKTILYGDKPYVEKAIDGKPFFEPKKVAEYKAIDWDFCCDEMKEYIKRGNDWIFGGDMFAEPCYEIGIYDGYGDTFFKEVFYCPFCREKVEYKEVEKSKYKKVKKFDYIEEAIK